MDILGPLSEKVIRYPDYTYNDGSLLEVTKSDLMSKMVVCHKASLFLENRAVTYLAHTHLLTDNETKFVSRFFGTLCFILRTKHLKAMAYHPQTTGRLAG